MKASQNRNILKYYKRKKMLNKREKYNIDK